LDQVEHVTAPAFISILEANDVEVEGGAEVKALLM
jgi:hypothetical protein